MKSKPNKRSTYWMRENKVKQDFKRATEDAIEKGECIFEGKRLTTNELPFMRIFKYANSKP